MADRESRGHGGLRLRKELHGKKELQRLVEERSGWYLVFRQTAPSVWPRSADPLTVNPWNLQADLFATLDERTIDSYRDPDDGYLTLRLQWSDDSEDAGPWSLAAIPNGGNLAFWRKGTAAAGAADGDSNGSAGRGGILSGRDEPPQGGSYNVWRQRSSQLSRYRVLTDMSLS